MAKETYIYGQRDLHICLHHTACMRAWPCVPMRAHTYLGQGKPSTSGGTVRESQEERDRRRLSRRLPALRLLHWSNHVRRLARRRRGNEDSVVEMILPNALYNVTTARFARRFSSFLLPLHPHSPQTDPNPSPLPIALHAKCSAGHGTREPS